MSDAEEFFAALLLWGGIIAVVVGAGLGIAGMHDVATPILSGGAFVAIVGFLAFALAEL